MGYIRAVCISEKKGTGKKNVGEAVFIEDEGLKGDAHAGKWHRQVSLLSKEAVEAFKKRGVWTRMEESVMKLFSPLL